MTDIPNNAMEEIMQEGLDAVRALRHEGIIPHRPQLMNLPAEWLESLHDYQTQVGAPLNFEGERVGTVSRVNEDGSIMLQTDVPEEDSEDEADEEEVDYIRANSAMLVVGDDLFDAEETYIGQVISIDHEQRLVTVQLSSADNSVTPSEYLVGNNEPNPISHRVSGISNVRMSGNVRMSFGGVDLSSDNSEVVSADASGYTFRHLRVSPPSEQVRHGSASDLEPGTMAVGFIAQERGFNDKQLEQLRSMIREELRQCLMTPTLPANTHIKTR